jgi:hypothetical protein
MLIMSSVRAMMPPSNLVSVRPHRHASKRGTTRSPVRYRMTGLAARPRLVTTSSPGWPSATGSSVAGSSTSPMNWLSLRGRKPPASQHSKLTGPTSVRP